MHHSLCAALPVLQRGAGYRYYYDLTPTQVRVVRLDDTRLCLARNMFVSHNHYLVRTVSKTKQECN